MPTVVQLALTLTQLHLAYVSCHNEQALFINRMNTACACLCIAMRLCTPVIQAFSLLLLFSLNSAAAADTVRNAAKDRCLLIDLRRATWDYDGQCQTMREGSLDRLSAEQRVMRQRMQSLNRASARATRACCATTYVLSFPRLSERFISQAVLVLGAKSCLARQLVLLLGFRVCVIVLGTGSSEL